MIAKHLHSYLNRAGVPYDSIVHERTSCALQTAHVTCVPPRQLAKGVVLRRAQGYLVAVVPASRRVRLDEVERSLHEPVCLATEGEAMTLFGDCEPGALPPLGNAYGIECIVDDDLEGLDDIYFEGGDHYTLIHVNGTDFDELTGDLPHADISRRH